ncbi:MAG: hypothetical protein IKU26_08815 [Clostridia bacterium]|nr:hypothetical protein [Clostridia bacterium]
MRKFAAVVLMAILFTTVSCQKQPEVYDPMQTESTQAASTKTPASTETPVRDPYYFNSQIGMWYTVWWDSEQSDPTYFQHHWVKETRIEPVKFGYYATDDDAKLEYDFRMFTQWGIDYLILDDTNNHLADSGNIANHINKIFKKAKKMGTDAPKLCFAGGQPLLQNDEAGMIREMDTFYNYATRYAEQTYFWNGKPLFVNFNIPKNYSWQDPQNRFTMRPAGGHTSEGWKTRYQNNLMEIGMYGWVFDKQYEGSEVYGITPGFSRSHNGLATSVDPLSRENGKRYQKAWLEAIKTNPKMIVIASWNDHAEETGIEAVKIVNGTIEGREYESENPYYYEQITQGYLALKTGYLEGFYYRAESETQVYRYENGALKKVSTPSKMTAVIVVPDDYYAWSGVSRNG